MSCLLPGEWPAPAVPRSQPSAQGSPWRGPLLRHTRPCCLETCGSQRELGV